MQSYYPFQREYTQEGTETAVYLRPEQIKLQNGAKTTEQSRNIIIRLSESIKKYGILEPLDVKRAGERDGYPLYELISGERRLRAAMIIGLDKIPCRILSESHRSCAILGILEQISRKSLNFFEQAAAFRMLMADFDMTQEEIARKSGFSQSAIANKLRLLQLTKEEQSRILGANLTERHARALLRLRDPQTRSKALFCAVEDKLNVAATEALVENLILEQNRAVDPPPTSQTAPISVVLSPQKPPSGVLPRKFALKDLTPLYNSIEHTLSIFRKTGATAICAREETGEHVRIVIDIPKKVQV